MLDRPDGMGVHTQPGTYLSLRGIQDASAGPAKAKCDASFLTNPFPKRTPTLLTRASLFHDGLLLYQACTRQFFVST